MSRDLGALARPTVLTVLTVLAACHGAPEPGPTPPPDPVAGPEALPPPTWAQVQAELPEAQAYVPTTHADPPAWLGETDALWLRVGAGCRAITLDADDHGRGAFEECHETIRKADVVCTRTVEVGHTFRVTSLQLCSATLASGAGGMGSATSSTEDTPIWSLVAADETALRYATTWELLAEAETLLWVLDECTPASVGVLTDALRAEGLAEPALREALHQRHGVLGHQRRCMEHQGVRLSARHSESRSWGDRGAASRTEPGLHDCTIPCRETTQALRRINATLSTQPYARVDDDAAAVVLHRTQAACEAAPDGGLPPLTENLCHGEWLDEVVTPRGKRR